MHPIVSTVTIIAAVANGYAQAQAVAGAAPLVLNGTLVTGGVGTPDAPRRVIITSGGNDSGIKFVINGTARPEMGGSALSETVAGTNGGVAASTNDFATVTSITTTGGVATTVTAGTNNVASGPWVPWDTTQHGTEFQVSCVGYVISGGAINWGVDYTYDDVFGLWLPANTFPRAIGLPALLPSVANASGSDAVINAPIRASRLTLNTAPGSAQLTQQQMGN